MLRIRKHLPALALCVAMAACADQAGMENVDVTMQQTDGMLTQAVSGWYASVTGGSSTAAAIDPDTVESLTITITDVEFLPVQNAAAEGDAGAWMPLELPQPVELDLMSLPTESESPLAIVSGAVDVGQYANVRLFTSSASIVFKGPIDLGEAGEFEGGTPYDVSIPSGEQTGIKTDASFNVEADAEGNINDVYLLFSPGSTFQNVTGTGTGEVILAPVIRSRPDES
jgi:hypothetical protein